jgi:hypothetical protein
MKKSLEQYALAAEIIGAIAVVISLVYVGTSVDQNTNAIRVSNHQALVAMDMEKNDWLRDSEFAAIHVIAMDDVGKLTPVQRIQYSTFIANTFNAWEFAFITHNNGMMDGNIWDGWDGFYKTVLEEKSHQWFWRKGREGFSPEFRSYVDSMLAEID